MRIFSLLLFLLMTSCTTVQYKDTYLKYSGYVEGCADATILMIMIMKPDLDPNNINPVFVDATCMDLYLRKLEEENIKPPMERLDENEMI